jgi:hypothetical protein
MTVFPWELSQIGEKARARRDRRRIGRLLGRGRLFEYLGLPCPYCGIAMSDLNGRNEWRAPSRDHCTPKSRGGRNRASGGRGCARTAHHCRFTRCGLDSI